MKKLLISIFILSLMNSSAFAATPKPTVKATAKPTVTSSAKSTVKATFSASKKPTVKKTYKPRPRPKPTVSVKASPSVAWPPKSFYYDNNSPDIYSKIPTNKELIGIASSNPTLSKQLKICESNVCGAILAASTAGCTWWKFSSEVRGPASDTDNSVITYGNLVSIFSSSKPKQIVPFILTSTEPIKTGVVVSRINIECHRDPAPTDIKFPNNSYTKMP